VSFIEKGVAHVAQGQGLGAGSARMLQERPLTIQPPVSTDNFSVRMASMHTPEVVGKTMPCISLSDNSELYTTSYDVT
jgi:hypothetical protein